MYDENDHIRMDILTDAMRKLRDVEAAKDNYKADPTEEGLEELEEEIFNLRVLLDELTREATLSADPYF